MTPVKKPASNSKPPPKASPLPLPAIPTSLSPVSYPVSPPSLSRPLSYLPSASGVYWFSAANGDVIYVGKAKSLKNRLQSYRSKLLDPKTKRLMTQTTATSFVTVPTEFDALLLEAQLIRHYLPRYNLIGRDDKTPCYIAISKDAYPKVTLIRASDLKNTPTPTVFGPFSSAATARHLLTKLRPVFPFCTKGPNPRHRPCFYYHLNLCPGVCTGQIPATEYQIIINRLKRVLKGHRLKLQAELKADIASAIKTQDFETAAALKQVYTSLISSISTIRDSSPRFVIPEPLHPTHTSLNRLRALINSYLLPKIPRLDRLELYDIANIQGKYAVGSMVVMNQGQLEPSAYRRFRIRSLNTPNDPAMLKEVIARRLGHPEWGTPSLIVVDGGLSQISAVKALSLPCPLIGLAKDPDRLVIPRSASKTHHPIKKVLSPENGGDLLIKLRNEAHRFANNYYQTLLTKSLT